MKNKQKKNKKKLEFSKKLLLQESALLWVVTIAFIVLAFFCIYNQFFGELPWLVAMASCPWAAYGVSQAFYYKKSEKENTKGGIVYDLALLNAKTNDDDPMAEEIVENAQG